MKKLAEKGVETVCEEPPFPKNGGEEEAAVWKMKVKTQQDKMKECKIKKEKVFSGILQKCDDAVIMRLESMSECKAAEEDGDAAALMGSIKKPVVGTSDRVFPGMQAANAWQTLGRMHQHDNESSLKHHRRFIAAVEHIEDVWGEIEPDELTSGIATGSNEVEEGRDQFLACVFVAGSNKTEFEGCRQKLMDDHADDQVSKHPKTVEEAVVVVMQACLDDHSIKIQEGTDFHQTDLSEIKCFCCKKMGHCKRDCPVKKMDEEERKNEKSALTFDVWGGQQRDD